MGQRYPRPRHVREPVARRRPGGCLARTWHADKERHRDPEQRRGRRRDSARWIRLSCFWWRSSSASFSQSSAASWSPADLGRSASSARGACAAGPTCGPLRPCQRRPGRHGGGRPRVLVAGDDEHDLNDVDDWAEHDDGRVPGSSTIWPSITSGSTSASGTAGKFSRSIGHPVHPLCGYGVLEVCEDVTRPVGAALRPALDLADTRKLARFEFGAEHALWCPRCAPGGTARSTPSATVSATASRCGRYCARGHVHSGHAGHIAGHVRHCPIASDTAGVSPARRTWPARISVETMNATAGHTLTSARPGRSGCRKPRLARTVAVTPRTSPARARRGAGRCARASVSKTSEDTTRSPSTDNGRPAQRPAAGRAPVPPTRCERTRSRQRSPRPRAPRARLRYGRPVTHRS